jgi:arsenate reductase
MKMKPLHVYAYAKCDTCRKALKFLATRGVAHEVVPIREQPPTVAELRRMLAHVGDLKKLFNTSGLDYKAMNMKERLPKLSETEALNLLAKNGNLVKRPFALTKNSGAVGFREDEWERLSASL